MKNLGQMMKQAQEMQSKIQEMQNQLTDMEVEGSAGGGLVTVTLSGKNELKKLSLISKPNLIIISNVANNHLENFQSEEDIAKAKSEIFHGLIKNGQIILEIQ